MSSSRVRGHRRPLGVPWRLWLERPTRWRKVAMLRGEPTWHTSSTGADVDAQLERGGCYQGF